MSEAPKPKGILKNAVSSATYKHESTNVVDEKKARVDRKIVIANTRMNSKLRGLTPEQEKLLRNRLSHQIKIQDGGIAKNASMVVDPDHLKWDEKNILLNEQQKCATMKIDEPKTPYTGGFNPNNEYYKIIDDDSTPDLDDEGINLGEGVADDKEVVPKTTIDVVKTPQVQLEQNSKEEEEEISPEEKHRLFELKRKQHYHMKANVLKHPLPVSDDEDDDKKTN